MHFKLICVGKTTEPFVVQGIEEFEKRLKHYIKYSRKELVIKSKGTLEIVRNEEGRKLLSELDNADFVVLMDELGKSMTSASFAQFLAKKMQDARPVVFVIGGAYGFTKEMYARADAKIALSAMTFPHQLVRVLFTEQLYRACTIIKGEKYHH